MGKWKKAVAALAAVPMLMALAPAANAVESDPSDSSAAQRALAAALKSNAKAAADSDLLASLDFDNVAAGATGTIVDDTTGTKATINGAAAVATSKDGTAAVRLGSGFWLNVTEVGRFCRAQGPGCGHDFVRFQVRQHQSGLVGICGTEYECADLSARALPRRDGSAPLR